MFEFNPNGLPLYDLPELNGGNLHGKRLNAAINLFNDALLRGKWFRFQAGLQRKTQWLLDLDTVKAGLRVTNAHYSGIRPVRIDRIAGSEGRVHEFDGAFHPVEAFQRDRWTSMAVAYLARVTLPPVQLIRIGDQYFVRDGHHRISVAAALHQSAVDAEVTVWEIGGRLSPDVAVSRDPLPVPARSAELCCESLIQV